MTVLEAVEGAKQRGGRTLSVVDLIQAGTLDLAVAATLCARIREGASFLVGARPGGAGKTTVMAALMAALGAEETVLATDGPAAFRATRSGPVCWLAHELNHGPYYAYIWGDAVRTFFERWEQGDRIVSNMHADTLDEMRAMLTGPPNHVPPERFACLDLAVFLRVARSPWDVERRVAAVHQSQGGAHELLYEWSPDADRWVARAEPLAESRRVRAVRGVLQGLLGEGIRDWGEVRRALLSVE